MQHHIITYIQSKQFQTSIIKLVVYFGTKPKQINKHTRSYITNLKLLTKVYPAYGRETNHETSPAKHFNTAAIQQSFNSESIFVPQLLHH